MNSGGGREATIAQMAGSDQWLAALREHVREIIEGEAFKGSHRSGQFLSYIVEQALAGHLELLKERMIGIELFGRSPSYDTSEDAIVRVTASDVRKRLLQHYGKYGATSEFRIALPLGSYVPEIVHEHHAATGRWDAEIRHPEIVETAAISARQPAVSTPAVAVTEIGRAAQGEGEQNTVAEHKTSRRWLYFAATLVVVNLAIWALLWKHSPRNGATAPAAAMLPWSVFFNSPHPTHLITSDPDIFSIQILTHNLISVSDYANRRYLPEQDALSPELKKICEQILSGDKASNVDAQIAAEVAEVAKGYSRAIEVQGARSLEFSSLKTNDNFIFLGSPSSDPWFSVFQNQLDFQFVSAPVPGGGLIRNVRPYAGEQTTYVPTARGGATGESFALAAFVDNPDQSGQVLLLAGLNREGTQAAGMLVTDQARFSAAIQRCGISPTGPARHFEMLLRVDTMAGSPGQFDVLACHILSGAPAS
jgi:hypothetical protein